MRLHVEAVVEKVEFNYLGTGTPERMRITGKLYPLGSVMPGGGQVFHVETSPEPNLGKQVMDLVNEAFKREIKYRDKPEGDAQ